LNLGAAAARVRQIGAGVLDRRLLEDLGASDLSEEKLKQKLKTKSKTEIKNKDK